MKISQVKDGSTWEEEASEVNPSGWREFVSSCVDGIPILL